MEVSIQLLLRSRVRWKERTNPVVHPQPRDTPENDHIPASEDLTSNDESCDHDGNTDIREENQG